MTTLLWITLSLAFTAVVVSLNALRVAPDGFEDDRGFHFVSDEAASVPASVIVTPARCVSPASASLVNPLRASHT